MEITTLYILKSDNDHIDNDDHDDDDDNSVTVDCLLNKSTLQLLVFLKQISPASVCLLNISTL